MLRLIVKDVKAAVSNLNISASEDDEFKPVEKKFLEAFKCFIEFNEAEDQAKLQVFHWYFDFIINSSDLMKHSDMMETLESKTRPSCRIH